MSWDLITAKALLGIPANDTSKDAVVNRLLVDVIHMVEDLLGRGLIYKQQVDQFYLIDHVYGGYILLSRYPVERIVSVDGGPPHHSIRVHNRAGWVYGVSPHKTEITIEYIGGFKELPALLERALWEIFRTVWDNSDQSTGLPAAGSGLTVIQGGGEVDRIALSDFGSVSFNYGASVVGNDANGPSSDQQAIWGWLAPWASVLQIYRSERAPSVAFA